MPKVNPLTERAKREQEKEAKDDMFRRYVKSHCALRGVNSQYELSKLVTTSPATMSYKLRNPDRFTRRELQRLFEVLNFSDKEKLEVM